MNSTRHFCSVSLALSAMAFFSGMIGCSTASRSIASDPEICERQHSGKNADGDLVTICDQAFAEQPFVRPPADSPVSNGVSTFYAALHSNEVPAAGIAALVDRKGNRYAIIDAKGKPVSVWKKGALPAAVHFPSHRSLFTLYQVQGVVTTKANPEAWEPPYQIQIKSLKPAILLSGAAIDNLFVGTWEGTASKHTDGSSGSTGHFHMAFDQNAMVPVQVTFTASKLMPRKLSVLDGGGSELADGEIYQLNGKITNFTSDVKSIETGQMIPALSSYGALSPFAGAVTDQVGMYRLAAMHTPTDEVVVFLYPQGSQGLPGSGMDAMQIALHPAALIQEKSDPKWSTLTVHPHGPPSGHVLKLHWVKLGH